MIQLYIDNFYFFKVIALRESNFLHGFKKVVLKRFVFSKWIFLFFLFMVANTTLVAKDFSNTTFAIAQFNTRENILTILKEDKEISDFGLSITIEQNPSNHSLQLKLDSGTLSLNDFFKALNVYISKNNKNIFPLFIDYSGDESLVVKELEATSLLSKAFYQSPGERWPSIESIVARRKTLVIFNQSLHKKRNDVINYSNDHVIDFSIKNSFNLNRTSVSSNNSMQNELLMIKKFTADNIIKEDVPTNWNKIGLNTFCIDYLLECWNRSGKRPNFIFYSFPKNNIIFHFLSKRLGDYPSVSGQVESNGKIVKDINWNNEKQSFTNGYFNFPYDGTAPLVLRPIKQGYSFSPQEILIDEANPKTENLDFTASPLSMSDGLTAYFKLNHSIENLIHTNEVYEQTKSFIKDNERGNVLKLENKSYVRLKNVTDYQIVNSSFTISVYFKLIEVSNKKEYCLFGSNEEGFRKGLHVLIRKNKPLFGFYASDCSSDFIIKPSKWYRITVRYDINSQVQSIFIDGKKVGEATNHPSFIGSSELLLGHSIKQNNYMNGYLSEMAIWNRALSDNEIRTLQNNNLNLHQIGGGNDSLYIFIGVVAIGLLGGLFFFRNKIRNNRVISVEPSITASPEANRIYLYGIFKVLDEDGTDHAREFSPKIKELFLLILLHSLSNKKGISTSKITEILWGEFTTAKAANNRGVTFNNLKKILSAIKGIEVVYGDEYWRIIVSEPMSCDYQEVYDIMKKETINYPELFTIIKSGTFLPSITKDWLLDFQSNHYFDLIDQLILYTNESYKNKDYSAVIAITTYIFSMDDLNVQALHYHLNSLIKQGSRSKAVYIFDKFSNSYRKVHTQPFEFNLNEFLKMNVEDVGGW